MTEGRRMSIAELSDTRAAKPATRHLRSGAVLAESAAPAGNHLRSGDADGNAAEAVVDTAVTASPHQEPKRRFRRELDALGGAELTLAAYVPRAASASAAAAITSALLSSPHRPAQHQQPMVPSPAKQLPQLASDEAMIPDPPTAAPQLPAKRKAAVEEPDALQPEALPSPPEHQPTTKSAAPRHRPSRAGSQRNAAAAELAALMKEETQVDLPRLRSRGHNAAKPEQLSIQAAPCKPLSCPNRLSPPLDPSCHVPADEAEVANHQGTAPAVAAQQVELDQQQRSAQQPAPAQQAVLAPPALPAAHLEQQVRKGAKELRMLTANMEPHPELPARRSQNAAAAVEATAPADTVPAGQPAPHSGQPDSKFAEGEVPVQRNGKRKQAAGLPSAAAPPDQQPQEPSRKVRQRVSRSGAPQTAPDSKQQPEQPAAKGIPLPNRSQKPAARDQPHASATEPLQTEKAAKQGANDAALPSVVEAAPAAPSAGLTALVNRFIEVLKPQPGSQVGLRQVMASGLLRGEPLAFCDRQKQPKMHGTVSDRGMIACSCTKCVKSSTQHSSSEWEVHAGSRERRPAESIYLTSHKFSLRELCLAIQAGAAGVSLEEALPELAGGSTCTGCGRPVQGCAPRLCRACGAAAKAALKRSTGDDAPPSVAKGGKKQSGAKSAHRASSGGGKGIKSGKASGGSAAKARVHLAQPAVRGVTGARAERSTHRHKKLFTDEPGALANGEPVEYRTTQGERLLGGVVTIDEAPGGQCGILCDCCATVISCSQFEAHAGKGSRRAPYDHIFTSANISLRRIAELMPCNQQEPEAAPQPGAVSSSVEAAMAGAEEVGGGCTLCGSPDFLRGAFGERTMLLCDQCEREFHVGCLRSSGRCVLDSIPEGDWFCSASCSGIHSTLRGHVKAGAQPLPGEHSWQIMRGKDGTHAVTWALKAARDLLSESFDPIIDAITGRDMLAMMVMAQAAGPWDYTGMHCVLLRHKGKPVAAALVRVFGHQLAELPLVATRYASRRQGHARVLMNAIEGLLAATGVRTLSLPAAQETVGTWMHGFAFDAMPEEQLAAVKKELRIIIFPGSTILSKRLVGGPPPPPPSPRHMQSPEDGAAAGSEDSDQAAEPALRLLHAQPAVASGQEAAAASQAPAQHTEAQRQPAQPAAAETEHAAIEGSAMAVVDVVADGSSAVAAFEISGRAQAKEGSPSGADRLVSGPTAAAAAAAATADSAGLAAMQPVAVALAAAPAVSDVQMGGSTAAASETAAATPSSPRGGGKRCRLDRLRQLLGLTISEEIPVVAEAKPETKETTEAAVRK